ncbi:GNAT family N-acetyltransferase [Aquimarina sp. AU474]|uniref:GNAT family N-acetyltransferase n=1 Tax=Aquimarina sp. AU474 TaxID=2108529 RepID=UPI000D6907A2|nr:GNAT family protein [Aquimarina sp. AU474]
MSNKKVSIRKLRKDDAMQLAELANNKKIWDNVRDYFPHPYDKEDALFFIDLTHKQKPLQSFGITYEDTLCGVISLITQNDVYKKSAEVGYWIGESFWSKGIMTKALALITDYGFNELNLVRIYTGVFEYNKASMKVLEKGGFLKEGISKKAILKNDQIWDEHRYYMLNPR